MKLLADMHVAPRTIAFLGSLGHDVVHVADVLSPSATDQEVIAAAILEGRTILTQDLDFTNIIALSGESRPSVITLRLATSRVEHVNEILARVLPVLESDVSRGAVVSVQDTTVRRRSLPIDPN